MDVLLRWPATHLLRKVPISFSRDKPDFDHGTLPEVVEPRISVHPKAVAPRATTCSFVRV